MSQRERWPLGGMAPEMYQHDLVPAIFGPWPPLLSGERVLDLACETSAVARGTTQ